jgi:hypothetical protein
MIRIRPIATRIALGIKILLLLVTVAWATNSLVNTIPYTGEAGSLNNINHQLLTTAKGFSTTGTSSATGTSCPGSPVTFGSGTVANTALASGHVIFDAQVNTTASTPINTCFSVTFYLSTALGSQSQLGPVYISTGGTVTSGQTIDCKFDLASSTMPTPPFSYRLAVQ